MALALAGVAAGSLLPDADSPGSKAFRSKALAPFAVATRFLVLLPASIALRLLGVRGSFEHRKLLHSVGGALLGIAFWLAVAYALVPLAASALAALAGGVFFGWMLHLYEDSLTVHGVQPLFPLPNRLSGRIKTGSLSFDPRRNEWIGVAIILALNLGQLWLQVTFATGLAVAALAWAGCMIAVRLAFSA